MRSIDLRRLRDARYAPLAAIVLIVAAAGLALAVGNRLLDDAAPASPTAAVADAPSVPPTRSPDADGIEIPISGPGSPAPTRGGPGGDGALTHAAWRLPAGWSYSLECGEEEGSTCSLHLRDATGTEQDSWPIAVPGDCYPEVAVGPAESAFVACDRDARVVVIGLDRTGRPLAGWPVRVRGSVAWSSSVAVAVGTDETVYVAVDPTGGDGRYVIHAFAQDGSPRQGWPLTIDGEVPGFSAAPDGTIVAWWYEGVEQETIDLQARRTGFTKVDPNGNTLAGWPIGSKGAASSPVAWGDGSIYYTSATGKVWGHDRAGEIIDGWPYELGFMVAPELRDDGALRFIGESAVVVLDRQGNVLPGWPYRTSGTLNAPSCDTDGWDYQLSAVAEDDRLYLATWDWDRERAAIVALDAAGRTPDGWPYQVRDGWRVTDLQVNSDGTVSAGVSSNWCDDYGTATLHLTAGGSLIGEPLSAPPTRLGDVYEALELQRLRTATGSTAFPRGAGIDIEGALVNGSTTSVILPFVPYGDEWWYAAGTIQTWLERLGPDPSTDCLPSAARKGAWYATGGWINVAGVPVTIPPGGSMPTTLQGRLWPALTACLPPGAYRYHVEYKPLESEDLDDVLDQETIDLTIVAGPPDALSPAPTPSPTPRITPKPTPTPTAIATMETSEPSPTAP